MLAIHLANFAVRKCLSSFYTFILSAIAIVELAHANFIHCFTAVYSSWAYHLHLVLYHVVIKIKWIRLWINAEWKRVRNERFIYCVNVTGALVLRLLPEDWGRITESIRILVLVNRVKQKYFKITTKRVRRSQQSQLRRQPVSCSLCNNRKDSVANSSTCPRHDEVATRWGA